MRTLKTLFLIALLLASLAARADSRTFTVQINPHLPMPAARVLVTFELDGPVGASTLTIGGNSTPIPGVLLPDGDQVSVVAPTVSAGDPNQIRIELLAKSMFDQSGTPNYCVLDPGETGARSVQMTLTTPAGVNITGYRINTYTIPAVAPGSALDCGALPSRRIISNEATLSFTGATSPFRGRHAIDVILVLDESGSMSSRPPGSGSGPSKWEILEDAIASFVDKWKIAGAPAPPQSFEGDRLGLVFFTTDATASSFSGSFFVRRGGAVMPHPWDAVVTTVEGRAPSALTALGKGVNTALDNWVPLPANTLKSPDAHFIVMTDGMQNVSPTVDPLGPTSILQLVPSGGGAAIPLHQYSIPMQGVAFGMAATTEHQLLTRLSEQTGGLAYQAIDQFTVYDTFADTLVNILKGGTLSLVHRQRNTLAGTAGPLVPVVVDGSVRRLMLSLEWSGPRQRLDVQLFPPGSTPGPNDTGITPTQRADRAESLVRGYDFPASGPAGTWLMRVVRGFNTTALPTVPYNLSAHVVEGRLRYRLSLEERERGTGDTLGVQAEVAFDGTPLGGLPPDAIRVAISRPNEGLGNILHGTQVDIPQGGGADPTSAYQRKIEALAADGSLQSRIAPVNASTITLAHQGNGVYRGTFDNTRTPGAYAFDATLHWDDPRTGLIHRIERLERNVRVNADPASTRVQIAPLGGGSYSVTVTPRDRFGNFVGPGYGTQLVATAANGTVAGPAVDVNETGDYVFRIDNVPDGQRPRVDFTLEGRPVGSASGGGVGPSGPGGPFGGASGPWRFFIDAGLNFPDVQTVDGVFSLNAGIERLFTPNLSIEGILGYHRFERPLVEPDIWQLSANAKYFFTPGPLRPFVNGGVGVYRIDPPDDTEFGWNVGAGLLYEVNAKWGFEAVYNYHSTDPVDWSTAQLGLRWHF